MDERKARVGLPMPVQITLGFFTSVAGIGICGTMGACAGERALAIIFLIVGAVSLGAAAFGLRGDERTRGWVIGLCLGIGIAGLLEGICFANLY
jgi:hypothetical protein